MAVTPKGIVTPDASSPYNLITDLNTIASTTDAAIATQRGTASQRSAALAGAPEGTLWQDTDSIKMIWRKDGAAWVPAITRWGGTTAQMNSFTQAPEGFEWFSTTDSTVYIRIGGAWVVYAPPVKNLPFTISAGWAVEPGYSAAVQKSADGLCTINTLLRSVSGGITSILTVPSEARPTSNSFVGRIAVGSTGGGTLDGSALINASTGLLSIPAGYFTGTASSGAYYPVAVTWRTT